MSLLTGNGQTYSAGAYTIDNNAWDAGNLVFGVDYTQQISYNAADLTNGLVMSWSFPEVIPPGYVYGYPEVVWGAQYGGFGPGTTAYANQVNNIKNLLVNYNVAISGETNNFDVGIEIWTTNKLPTQSGSTIENEIMVKVHGFGSNGGLSDGQGIQYSTSGLSTIESIHYNSGGGSSHTFVTIDSTADVLSGQIDFASILDDLVAEGIVSKTDYVSGVELGFEQIEGSGSATVNNFSVTENLGPVTSFALTVSKALTAYQGTNQVSVLTAPVNINDTAANVAASLDALQTLAHAGMLSGITLTDGGTPTLTLTAAQLVSDASVLNAISGSYTLSVPGVDTSIANFIVQQDTSGRGVNGIAVDSPGTASSGNSVIGFQNASFKTTGFDTVILDGPKSSYAIAVDSGGTATIKDIGVGDATFGQTVTVSGASYIIFNGDHISTSDPASAAALTTVPGTTTSVLNYPNDLYFILTPANAQLAQFYSSILPWEPQPALSGFEYWANQLAGGMSLQSIAQSFINTSYFQQTFGSPGTTTAEHQTYVELLYKNILGLTLTASNSGVEYWVGQMDSGALDGAQTLISFTNATSTVSTINAMSGATAGGGAGWLINYSATGGYADPGAQVLAATVLSEAAASGYYNLSLVDPTSVSNAGVSANGITLTPDLVTASAAVTSGTIILSSSFSTANINGSGITVHDGQGTDVITITGANNTLSLGSATTDTLNLAGGTNTSVLGYAPGKGSVLEVNGLANETAASLLNGTTAPVNGAGLDFGTATAPATIVVNVGSIGGGTTTDVLSAIKAAYTVADANGSATSGALGEHVIFIGLDSGGDTEIWAFRAPLSSVTANGHTVQMPLNSADLNANLTVDANEITLLATLIGVPTTNLTAAEFA